jgi:L-fuculose-phosphate aldolase
MNHGYAERIGCRLHNEGLVSANFGNMSVRAAGGFWITRLGSYLDNPGSLILCPFEGEVPHGVSSEYRVHRESYLNTGFQAIIHAHPPHAIAASFTTEEIVPRDSEGEGLCPFIPVVGGKPGTRDLAVSVASALTRSPLVIARGHGTFAAGKSLEDAYILTSLAEHSSKILLLLGQGK